MGGSEQKNGGSIGASSGEERWKDRPLGFLFSVAKDGFLGKIWWSIGLTSIAALAEGIGPWIFGKSVDAAMAKHPNAWLWFACWSLALLLPRIMYRTQDWILAKATPWFRAKLMERLHSHALRHDAAYFLKSHGGALGQKVRQAAVSGFQLLGQAAYEWPRVLVIISLALGTMWMASPSAAGVIFVIAIVFVSVSWRLSNKVGNLAREYAKLSSEATGEIADSFSNADLARAYRSYDLETDRMRLVLSTEAEGMARMKIYMQKIRLFQVMAMALAIMLAIGIWFGGLVRGEMSIGDFTALTLLVFMTTTHLQTILERSFELRESRGNFAEALEKLLEPHRFEGNEGDGLGPAIKGEITITEAVVRYGDRVALGPVSVRIKPGERVGLVGTSGSGKTTLAKAIRREVDVSEGSVSIDGRDVRNMGMDSLAASITDVAQNPSLYKRSILENIRTGKSSATREDCAIAAKKAVCEDFLMKIPEGIDAIVGERGMTLSGGERQRIAIARAFLRDSPIVILDEATSALDSLSENMIQEGLFRLMKGRTALVIAHRLSTIRKLDRILVMENGKIIEDGKHEDLLAIGGRYAALWLGQGGDFLVNENEENFPKEDEPKSVGEKNANGKMFSGPEELLDPERQL